MINDDVRQGLFFGSHSGVITTAGLLFGLMEGKITIKYLIISVLSLAIADGSSEGYGMFLSKKAEKKTDDSFAPLYAALSLAIIKFLTVLSFLLPLLFTRNLEIYKKPYWMYSWSIFILFIIDSRISYIRKEPFLEFFIPHLILLFAVTQTTKFFSSLI